MWGDGRSSTTRCTLTRSIRGLVRGFALGTLELIVIDIGGGASYHAGCAKKKEIFFSFTLKDIVFLKHRHPTEAQLQKHVKQEYPT